IPAAASNGADFRVQVSCTDGAGHLTPTRFTLFFLSEASGPASDFGAYAFTKVLPNQASGSGLVIDPASTWTTSGSSVGVSFVAPGTYQVMFSGMGASLAGKPILVTSTSTGV